MTSRGAYENILMELRKVKAPSLHLEDYLYFMNKGVQEYINERYNKFQISQQITDDLTALITSKTFVVDNNTLGHYADTPTVGVAITTDKRYNSDYISFLAPSNYWHMIGTHVNTFTKFPTKCAPAGYNYFVPAKKLSATTGAAIISNTYLRPTVDRVYHDFSDYSETVPGVRLTYYFGDINKYGIKTIAVDYLKKPIKIVLTDPQITSPSDTSQTLEFPEYVCNEIIKRVVKLILENSSDPRVQTNIPINQSIP
jgi:hypothetical protein